MKKILSIALIAALVATSAFAAISGKASVGLGYDFDNKKYGFDNTGSMGKITVDWSKEFFNEEAEKVGSGNIYAGIKASVNLSAKATLFDQKIEDTDWEKKSYDKGFSTELEASFDDVSFVLTAKILEAYITNGAWKLNILGSKAASDYATSALDSYKDGSETKYVSATAPSATANPGVVFTMDGYTASLGLWGEDKDVDFNAMVETKEFDFDGITLQGAIVAGNVAATKDFFFGSSLKGGFKAEDFEVALATDFGIAKKGDADATFSLDATVKAVGYGVTVDAYYATDATAVSAYKYNNKNLLSAQVAYDATIEDVKLGVKFTGLDLVNNQDLKLTLSGAYDKISGSVYGGYIIGLETWQAGFELKYAADMFTAKANLDAKNDELKVGVSISSDKLVDGATLEAGYESGNLLADPAKAGKISASATIAF